MRKVVEQALWHSSPPTDRQVTQLRDNQFLVLFLVLGSSGRYNLCGGLGRQWVPESIIQCFGTDICIIYICLCHLQFISKLRIRVRVMAFKSTFNNISVISWRAVSWGSRVPRTKIIYLPQVNDKLQSLYTSPFSVTRIFWYFKVNSLDPSTLRR